MTRRDVGILENSPTKYAVIVSRIFQTCMWMIVLPWGANLLRNFSFLLQRNLKNWRERIYEKISCAQSVKNSVEFMCSTYDDSYCVNT